MNVGSISIKFGRERNILSYVFPKFSFLYSFLFFINPNLLYHPIHHTLPDQTIRASEVDQKVARSSLMLPVHAADISNCMDNTFFFLVNQSEWHIYIFWIINFINRRKGERKIQQHGESPYKQPSWIQFQEKNSWKFTPQLASLISQLILTHVNMRQRNWKQRHNLIS